MSIQIDEAHEADMRELRKEQLRADIDPSDCEDLREWIDCRDCGGEGDHDGICQCEDFEDTCCCATPTPKRCSTCKGNGGWYEST
jgi:hypothetical protein